MPFGVTVVLPVPFGSKPVAVDLCFDRILGAMLTSVLVVKSSAFFVEGSSETDGVEMNIRRSLAPRTHQR